MTATYLGTRCCGASTSTPHWVGCVDRLDVNDPASYRDVPDEVYDYLCANCGLSNIDGLEVEDETGGFWICLPCWEKVP